VEEDTGRPSDRRRVKNEGAATVRGRETAMIEPVRPIDERHISEKAFAGHYAAAVVGAIALAALLFAVQAYPFVPAAVLPVAAVFVYARVIRAGNTYRLYPDRLEVESGLIGRKIENVELFRIRDIGLRQGFLGRMANWGDVYVHSTDSSTPDLHIRAIDAPKEFYQQLRQLVSSARAQSRTMIVEESQPMPEA
jgi:membrane protein YdbS with pleckstrin-like domain